MRRTRSPSAEAADSRLTSRKSDDDRQTEYHGGKEIPSEDLAVAQLVRGLTPFHPGQDNDSCQEDGYREEGHLRDVKHRSLNLLVALRTAARG